MLRSTCLLVLGLAAAALAQESSYTGPPFDPYKEPYFAQTGLVIPTATDLPAIEPSNAFSMATTIPGIIIRTSSSLPAISPSNEFSMATTISGIILPSTTARPSSHASSSRSSASRSTSSGSVSSAAATSATASAPATQSSGAAVANRVGLVGAVAGGLLAGLALA